MLLTSDGRMFRVQAIRDDLDRLIYVVPSRLRARVLALIDDQARLTQDLAEARKQLEDVGDALDGQYPGEQPCAARAVQQQREALDTAKDELAEAAHVIETLEVRDKGLRAELAEARRERDALKERASTLEDAAFHYQTCSTCARDGEDACLSGRKFAAFLRGEEKWADA